MSRFPSWVLAPATPSPGRLVRRLLAAALRRASAWLVLLSRRLQVVEAAPDDGASGFIEFHAEAGAPEGALYVDGMRVGTLPVTRL